MIRQYRSIRGSLDRSTLRGFTLVELAIVMGIAGILLTGLWRIVAASNGQMRDQAAASQQTQLISAIGQFLQSPAGQAYMAPTAALGSGTINLPTSNTSNSVCKGTIADINAKAICDFLPPGFTSTTVNSYGQTFTAQFLKDNAAVNVAPQSYTYMVLTTGGDTIPDTSGGRISGFIGSDGGFIYSNNVCGTPVGSTACGAYGAWSNTVGTYGFAGTALQGHIASRTFYSPLTGVSNYWLARMPYPGDTGFSYNTMSTGLYMNSTAGIHMAPFGTATGGSTLFTSGGNIDMTTSGTALPTTGGQFLMGILPATPPTTPGLYVYGEGIALAPYTDPSSVVTNATLMAKGDMNVGSLITLNSTTCHKLTQTDPCNPLLLVNGDATVNGLLIANSLYAQTFIYSTSDIRMKKNIVTLSNPLDDIMKLRPVSFDYKSNGEKSLGVIAQELEKVYPELVKEMPDGTKTVSYEGLVSPLIGAVQDLKRQNDDLRKQLHEQALRQEKMEHQLEQMRGN